MDLAKIEELIRIVRESQISELTVRDGDGSVTIKKGALAPKPPDVKDTVKKARAPKSKHQEPKPAPQSERRVIRAPMVGIFHAVHAVMQPGAPVSQGQSLGAIESMKLMNDIISESGGTITEVLVEDGLPVEFGQALFRLEPREVEK